MIADLIICFQTKISCYDVMFQRAVAVMRSECDVDTMLDAMGGGCLATEPPAKRVRSTEVKAELRRRVEALLVSRPFVLQ